MPEPRLVLPYDVEGALIEIIDARHAEHLAKAERLRGLAPKWIEEFATVVRMADASAVRLSGDTVPALLLGVIGAPQFVRNDEDRIDATYQLGMQVTVMGEKRRDVLLKRDLMAWTVAECLYQRVPRGRGNLIHSVRLTDYEPLSESETQRTLGDARMIWEIGVKDVLAITGGLPPHDSDWPSDHGGAPEHPYDPPTEYPTAIPTFEIDRRPLVE
jgi:hypothetical protein